MEADFNIIFETLKAQPLQRVPLKRAITLLKTIKDNSESKTFI